MSNTIQINCSSTCYVPSCGSGDGSLGGTQGLGKYRDFTRKVGPFAVRCARRAVRRYAQREIENILASEIRAMRPTSRTAIEMRKLQELSTCKTAGKMGISVVAAKSRLFHGKVALRSAMRLWARGHWEQMTVEMKFLNGSWVPFANRERCGPVLAAQIRTTEYRSVLRAPASGSHRNRDRVFLNAGPKCH